MPEMLSLPEETCTQPQENAEAGVHMHSAWPIAAKRVTVHVIPYMYLVRNKTFQKAL
jgi:hypothetical protein